VPGKLVVVGRPDAVTFWALLAAGVSAAEAAPVVQDYLTKNAAGRVAICQVLRSFAAVAQVNEDADPKVDP
jgi:hypothetical protein